jgi:hypothetical protein
MPLSSHHRAIAIAKGSIKSGHSAGVGGTVKGGLGAGDSAVRGSGETGSVVRDSAQDELAIEDSIGVY